MYFQTQQTETVQPANFMKLAFDYNNVYKTQTHTYIQP